MYPSQAPEVLARALSYPYRIPSRSYLLSDGEPVELGGSVSTAELEGRTPVLAIGSNQSPEQLARKFEGRDWGEIPVILTELSDFDTVYSPHITSYGSIPATLRSAPGVTVTLFVNWLNPVQLQRMHETEISSASYKFGRLSNISTKPETGPTLGSAYVYTSWRGALFKEGAPIPLSEIPAEGRKWKSMSQEDVQRHARDRLEPDRDLHEFIRGSVKDHRLRRNRTQGLQEESRPFVHPDYTAVEI